MMRQKECIKTDRPRRRLQALLVLVICIGVIVPITYLAGKARKESSYDVYQKFAEGLDVNILIVGDSIGMGSGAEVDEEGTYRWKWYKQLVQYLTDTYYEDSRYNGEITVTNVSMGGNASYAGYVRTVALDDGIDYDLVIICYGQNDAEEDFGLYYESILCAIGDRYPECAVIAILESSQRTYTDKIQTIQEICAYYGIPVADTIAAFEESGYTYEELCDDGTHPNNLGQTVYCETVKEVIEERIAAAEDPDYERLTGIGNVPLYDEAAAVFCNALWMPAGGEEADGITEFVRVDDVTYTIAVSASGLLGIHYTWFPGESTVEVYVDGELFDSLVVNFNVSEGFTQQHIVVVAEDCTVEEEITVVFDTEEHADEFYGMCLSWK